MPSLPDLPTELRQQIYALVVARPESIKLESYDTKQTKTNPAVLSAAPRGHHRDRKHRGEMRDVETGVWLKVPSNVAIIYISKQTLQDAIPLLYGENEFEFRHAGALERFLNQIGTNKQFLRHLSLAPGGYTYGNSYNAVHRCFDILATSSNDLRSFGIAHREVCIARDTSLKIKKDSYDALRQLVEHCGPYLVSLKVSYRAQNLSIKVADVFQIRLQSEHPHWYPEDMWYYACQCRSDREVEKSNEKMKEALRKMIVRQPGLKDA